MDAINKLLNELINKSDVTVRITNLSTELLETLKIIENCTSCKKDEKMDGNGLDECLAELEKKEQIWQNYTSILKNGSLKLLDIFRENYLLLLITNKKIGASLLF